MKRLKELRLKYGYTQQFVAEKLKLTQQAYSYYESGAHCPTPEMVVKLANVFLVSTDYLLENNGDTFHEKYEKIEESNFFEKYKNASPDVREQVDKLLKY